MRTSGVLLPVFSLPSPHGIGCFSKEAYEWVDFLKLAGQQYWQILPLGPTSYGDSPYQSFSTYAGNPYFIDLEELVEAGFLTRKEVEACDCGKAARNIEANELKQICNYEYFTDIEFNPAKSINTQARSVAIVKLMLQLWGEVLDLSPEQFLKFHSRFVIS